jgi:hypothetical protein
VVMAKRVASSWLKKNAKPEFRLTVYSTPDNLSSLPSLIKAFRSEKIRLGSVEHFGDIGVRSTPDSVTLWSRNQEGMASLDRWLVARGCETTGVW